MSFPAIFAKQNNEIGRFFEDSLWGLYNPFKKGILSNVTNDFYPRIDISENDKEYYIEFDLPGLKKEEIQVKIEGRALIIYGKKENIHEEQGRNFYIRERAYGEFSRSINLPENADIEKIEALFNNGVLQLRLNKQQSEAIKHVEIH